MTRFLAGSVEFDADGSASDVVGRVESLLGLTLESDRVETGVAEYFAGDVLGLRVHLEVPVEAPRRCTLSYRADNRYAGDFGEPVDVDFHFARILRGE